MQQDIAEKCDNHKCQYEALSQRKEAANILEKKMNTHLNPNEKKVFFEIWHFFVCYRFCWGCSMQAIGKNDGCFMVGNLFCKLNHCRNLIEISLKWAARNVIRNLVGHRINHTPKAPSVNSSSIVLTHFSATF